MPSERPDIGEVERDQPAAAAEDERVRHLHAVPGRGEAVAEEAAGEDAGGRAATSDGIRVTSISPSEQDSESRSQPSERSW